MSLNDSVGQQDFQLREKGFEIRLRFYELDAEGHVLIGIDAAALPVHLMMRSKASLRPRNRRPCYAVLEEKRQDFIAEKIFVRARVRIQMDRHFLGWTGSEHAFPFGYVLLIPGPIQLRH